MNKFYLLLLCLLTVGLFTPRAAEAARPDADLDVQIVQPASVVVRAADSYTVTVANVGGRRANNVQLVIDLPLTNTSPQQHILGNVSNASNNCQLSDKLVCTLGNIRQGKSKSVSFDLALPTSSGALALTATVITDSAESDTLNNTDTVTPTIQYPNQPLSGGPASHSFCVGTNLTAFFECELYPSSISTYGSNFATNGTITFTNQPDYEGSWHQNGGTNTLSYTIKHVPSNTIGGEFNGFAIGGNCYEGVMTYPNSNYVGPTKVCF